MKKREISFPTILGIVITILGLGVGIVLLRNPLFSLVGATQEEAPQQLKITNVSDTEFVVSWITDKAVSGFVQYGEGDDPELIVSDDRDQERGVVGNYFTHYVTARGLKPSTTYNFRVGSGKGVYDQMGELYSIATGPQLSNPPSADVTYGQVTTSNGDPAEGAIVYLQIQGIVPQATLVKSSGSWVIPLATSRTLDLTSFAPYDRQVDKMELFVQAGSVGSARVLTSTGEDSPVPTIILGETQDYTANVATAAAILGPTDIPASSSSKFSALELGPATETGVAGSVNILTPQIGESVNTTQPEIIGRGPADSQIQIEIHSDEVITGTVTSDSSGNWSFSVPQNLSPGEHTITVTTIVDGIISRVRRSFIVSAAEESNDPAFTATPSATLATTPTLAPTQTPTLAPTLAPRVAIPSTSSGVPQSGNPIPTWSLILVGGALVTAGLFSYKLKS